MGCACSTPTDAVTRARARARGININDLGDRRAWRQRQASELRAESMQRDALMFTALASVSLPSRRTTPAAAAPPATTRLLVTGPHSAPAAQAVPPDFVSAEALPVTEAERIGERDAIPLQNPLAAVGVEGSWSPPPSYHLCAAGLDGLSPSDAAEAPLGEVSSQQLYTISLYGAAVAGHPGAVLTPASTFRTCFAATDPEQQPPSVTDSIVANSELRPTVSSIASVATSNAAHQLHRRAPSSSHLGRRGSRRHHAAGDSHHPLARHSRAAVSQGVEADDGDLDDSHRASLFGLLSGVGMPTTVTTPAAASSWDMASPTNLMVIEWLRQTDLPFAATPLD